MAAHAVQAALLAMLAAAAPTSRRHIPQPAVGAHRQRLAAAQQHALAVFERPANPPANSSQACTPLSYAASCEAAQHLHMCGTSCASPRQTASGTFPLLLNSSCLPRHLLAHQGRPEADAALAAATPSVTVASVSHSRRSQ